MSEETDIAWAAGFIDGEGCLQIRDCGTQDYYARIAATQLDKRPLVVLQQLFGGGIYNQNAGASQWELDGARKCLPVLMKIQPFLRVKDRECWLLIKFCELLIASGYRKGKKVLEKDRALRREYHERLKGLKDRGFTLSYEIKETTGEMS